MQGAISTILLRLHARDETLLRENEMNSRCKELFFIFLRDLVVILALCSHCCDGYARPEDTCTVSVDTVT